MSCWHRSCWRSVRGDAGVAANVSSDEVDGIKPDLESTDLLIVLFPLSQPASIPLFSPKVGIFTSSHSVIGLDEWTFPFPKILLSVVFTAHLYSRLVAAADNCAASIRDGRFKMHYAEIHNGHECHHHLQSRRVKLTTGNTRSMQMCTILLSDLLPKTQ